MISSTSAGPAIRATPPRLRMSAGTASRDDMTATAPVSSAMRACSPVHDVHDDAALLHLREAALDQFGPAPRALSRSVSVIGEDWMREVALTRVLLATAVYVGGKGGDGLIRREANLLHRSQQSLPQPQTRRKPSANLSRDRIGTANTHKALGRSGTERLAPLVFRRRAPLTRSRGPPALLAALRCLKVRGSRASASPFQSTRSAQHRSPALPWSRGRDIVGHSPLSRLAPFELPRSLRDRSTPTVPGGQEA